MRFALVVTCGILLSTGIACGPEPYPTSTPYPTATQYPGWDYGTPTPYPTATPYPTSTPYPGEATATPTPTPTSPPTATPWPTPRPRPTATPRKQANTADLIRTYLNRSLPTLNRILDNALQGVPPSASDCSALERILREGYALEERALNDPSIDLDTFNLLLYGGPTAAQEMLIAFEAEGLC